MADIGVLPTKTGVQITSSTGDNGTIPGATPKAAGCMTAEQVRKLDELYAAHHSADGATVVIQAQQQDTVTKAELRAAVAQMQRVVSANAQVAIPAQSLAERLSTIEQALSAPALPDATVIERLAAAEHKLKQIAGALEQIVGAHELLCGEVDRLSSGQTFIEKHALVGVEVKALPQ